MSSDGLRHIGDFQPQIPRALFEIDVLEPERAEALIEAA